MPTLEDRAAGGSGSRLPSRFGAHHGHRRR